MDTARRSWRHSIAAVVLAFLLLEAAIFRTGLYAWVIEPDSTTGWYETQLRNEIQRPVRDRNQVLAVGHSRQPLNVKVADAEHTGYSFATIALGGVTPRCWYYALRTVDPTARRYRAILIPCDDYDEPDEHDTLSERDDDVHYLACRLGYADAVPFAFSHDAWTERLKALRGVLFKSFLFRSDFQAFLTNPVDRIRRARQNRRDSAAWYYGFEAEDFRLTGLSVDWNARHIDYPAQLSPPQREMVQNVLFRSFPEQTGRATRYYRRWYESIIDRYKGTGTRLVFFRVPRGPVVGPRVFPVKPHSAVRDLATAEGVTVLDEHLFDDLERPEWFGDALHMNRYGCAEFSRRMATLLASLLR